MLKLSMRGVIERSVILSRGPILQLAMPETDIAISGSESPPEAGRRPERDRILQALKESNGFVSGPKGAAQRLGMKRTALQSRMKKLGITRDFS
jgi:formate hydrogenlyase transcriptional activator